VVITLDAFSVDTSPYNSANVTQTHLFKKLFFRFFRVFGVLTVHHRQRVIHLNHPRSVYQSLYFRWPVHIWTLPPRTTAGHPMPSTYTASRVIGQRNTEAVPAPNRNVSLEDIRLCSRWCSARMVPVPWPSCNTFPVPSAIYVPHTIYIA
jgi:hypothetical protein